MIGSTHNKWTIVEDKGRSIHGERIYLCRCECGTEKINRLTNLPMRCKECHVNKYLLNKGRGKHAIS